LRGVNLAARASQRIWFNDPNATRGPSPDATSVLSGREVAIEIKAKLEQPADRYRPQLVENTLGEARRKQFPADGPSVIYLQIGAPWAQDEDVLSDVYVTCERFLGRSGRVSAVVVMLERHIRHSRGVRVVKAHLTVANRHARFPLPDIQGWLD
jgi:hypothetical protein